MYKSFTDCLNKPPTELDLVLIGKTGNGKSAAGNSILNKPKNQPAFKTSYKGTSETRYPSYDSCEFQGYKIQVVDSPGLFDTKLDTEVGTEMFQGAMQNIILANPKGFHAFLLVLKFGNRFTEDETMTIKILKKTLGKDFLKNYGIILLTNGDTFRQLTDIETFCAEEQEGFGKVLKECSGRIVVFDNMTDDAKIRQQQREKLLELVLSLENNNKRYTNKHFQIANNMFTIEKAQKALQVKDFTNTQSYFLDRIYKTEASSHENKLSSMKEILEDLSNLNSRKDDIIPLSDMIGDPVNKLLKSLAEARTFVNDRITELERENTGPEGEQKNTADLNKLQDILKHFKDTKTLIDKAYFSMLETCIKESRDYIIRVPRSMFS